MRRSTVADDASVADKGGGRYAIARKTVRSMIDKHRARKDRFRTQSSRLFLNSFKHSQLLLLEMMGLAYVEDETCKITQQGWSC